jgi:hypothetical protein
MLLFKLFIARRSNHNYCIAGYALSRVIRRIQSKNLLYLFRFSNRSILTVEGISIPLLGSQIRINNIFIQDTNS